MKVLGISFLGAFEINGSDIQITCSLGDENSPHLSDFLLLPVLLEHVACSMLEEKVRQFGTHGLKIKGFAGPIMIELETPPASAYKDLATRQKEQADRLQQTKRVCGND